MEILIYDPRKGGNQPVSLQTYARSAAVSEAEVEALDDTLRACAKRLAGVPFGKPAPFVAKTAKQLVLVVKPGPADAGLFGVLALLQGMIAALGSAGEATLRADLEMLRSTLGFIEARLREAYGAASRGEGITMSLVGTPGGDAKPGTTQSATFTLTNRSDAHGSFRLQSEAEIVGAGQSIAVAGYLAGESPSHLTWFPTFEALKNKLAAASIAPNDSLTVAVQYVVPDANAGAQIITRLSGVALDIGERLSAATNDIVVDAVAPQPAARITAPTGTSITQGSTATDQFTLTNVSGQSATFALGSAVVSLPNAVVPIVAFVIGTGAGTPRRFSSLADTNAALLHQPVSNGATITLGIAYVGPAGNRGTAIATTISVTTTAGGVPGNPSIATISNTIGDPAELQLQTFAANLAANARKHLSETEARRTLADAAKQVEAVANEPGRLQDTTQVLAWTLAIAESMQIIFDKLAVLEEKRIVDSDAVLVAGGSGLL